MEKYKPLRMGDKSSYRLSSKDNKKPEDVSEFNVVLTNNVFKKKNLTQELKNSKARLETSLIRQQGEYSSTLIKINSLIDIGIDTLDENKLNEIEHLVRENKDKKIFIQQEIDRIGREIVNVNIKISGLDQTNNSVIRKYNL